jgi:hypothetical protein
VKLDHLAVVVKKFSLEFNFAIQQFQIPVPLVFMPGDLLHAPTVVAKRPAKRKMHI